MESLEKYFLKFRNNIVGIDAEFETPYGIQKMVYADWIASGRLYKPVEDNILNNIGPLIGNTHSESSETGKFMTDAYHISQKIIKKHVNSSEDDVIITAGSGMTGVVNKLQRILGLKLPELSSFFYGPSAEKLDASLSDMGDYKPVVFVTHMEHHSNHLSWLETIADVVVLQPDHNLLVVPEQLTKAIEKYKHRKLKIGAFTAASNVTGIASPYYELAKIMHKYKGYCFVDFAASAPYVSIDMHPADPEKRLDAIYFSPHKFLGGPGSAGVLIFNKELYKIQSPDQPGGGTVLWTNRWGEFHYIDNIEAREDGGTPGFLQAIRAAYSIKLKEKMGCDKMMKREDELLDIAFKGLSDIENLHILAEESKDRIGVISFYIDNIHHNLIVKLLNDRFGIQLRAGCTCAGTYGHFLLDVDLIKSHKITSKIDHGDLSDKPGWVRLSLHPTMTNKELQYIIDSIKRIIENVEKWKNDYHFSKHTGEFYHNSFKIKAEEVINSWFEL